jgi:hypothetical protein
MANEEADRGRREVKNHVLFEIATEVAHRGKLLAIGRREAAARLMSVQLAVSTL